MEDTLKEYGMLKVETGDRIATITLNSPKTLNAFTWQFPGELHRALTEISGSQNIHVVILKAEGKVFSAGAGMDAMKFADTPYKVKTYMSDINRTIRRMYDMPQPIICAMDGPGAGGGANLALSCDFVIASEKAKFANVFVNLGIVPDTGGLWNLCRLTSPMRAKEIIMRGRTLSAEEAFAYGLVTKVVSSEELYKEVMALAEELSAKPLFTIRSIKRICNRMPELTHETYCELEEDLMCLMFFMKDHHEGVNAFLEKRRPEFKGEDDF